MKDNNILQFIENVIKNMPNDWLELTTHRLDIYDETLAKTEFLTTFNTLYKNNDYTTQALRDIPTAYDYIRLGHPLSCVLEWGIANLHNTSSHHVISFSSRTAPILAVLRYNLLAGIKTRICYKDTLPDFFNPEILKRVYKYNFQLEQIDQDASLSTFEGTTIYVSNETTIKTIALNDTVDFYVSLYDNLGSIILINGKENERYISEIQHVRRRETIAMTPANCLVALKSMVKNTYIEVKNPHVNEDKNSVVQVIKSITGSNTKALVASSGLSIQYAIMMGLVDDALQNHKGKAIKFIVPPNCYGGTNDQARRVAACIDNVAIVDLPVDGDNDMVQSIDRILNDIAKQDAIPYIIAEIPTNPRVEVPDLQKLKKVLTTKRYTKNNQQAVDPVFILDQTFCPNVHFLGEGEILSTLRAISYASGSKFPSGGKCTAGYCIGNTNTTTLMEHIALHLSLCDNEATALQYHILAQQLPSMTKRIEEAYIHTREFVTFIEKTMPEAKINFVSTALALQGFTPSVFSLDLPTKGTTAQEKETYKRALNLKLINLMITEIPTESKFCVSYGQLKGCYWTVPATSTQGTTKEGDKDYIVRASLSPNLDLERHKQVFLEFANGL